MAQCFKRRCEKALNSLEVAFIATPPNKDKNIHILDTAVQATQAMRYDRDGDSHYDIFRNCVSKSIRGSDPDAAVHYLARLVCGDLPSICRQTF